MDILDDTIQSELKIKNVTFIFSQAFIIIKQKKWFINKEIKRIELNSIQKINLIEARPVKTALGFIFSFISESLIPNNIILISSFNRHILINYKVGEDDAKYRLDINISKREVTDLNEKLKKIKTLNH